MRDFKLEKYERLCKNIIANDYRILTFRDYLLGEPKPRFVILRHDVDSKPKRALMMARLENNLNIRTSYYFRYNKSVFNSKIIKEIDELGHEIGYHYEVLSKTKGDYAKAIELFELELNEFRKICRIDTICMHGSPLSKYDNRDMWKAFDFKLCGIIGEAYLSAGKNLDYFSDTGWNWNQKHKLRDRIYSSKYNITINSTDDLMDLMETKGSDEIYLLVHPGNWARNFREWSYTWGENKISNIAKLFLKFINKYEISDAQTYYEKQGK
jgi:hypothetical protein